MMMLLLLLLQMESNERESVAAASWLFSVFIFIFHGMLLIIPIIMAHNRHTDIETRRSGSGRGGMLGGGDL